MAQTRAAPLRQDPVLPPLTFHPAYSHTPSPRNAACCAASSAAYAPQVGLLAGLPPATSLGMSPTCAALKLYKRLERCRDSGVFSAALPCALFWLPYSAHCALRCCLFSPWWAARCCLAARHGTRFPVTCSAFENAWPRIVLRAVWPFRGRGISLWRFVTYSRPRLPLPTGSSFPCLAPFSMLT